MRHQKNSCNTDKSRDYFLQRYKLAVRQNRYFGALIVADAFAASTMAFVIGPWQVGKTTLAKSLLQSRHNYFSWDDTRFRQVWSKSAVEAVADRGPGPICPDEICLWRI